jgi:ATP-dependent DNA ligase
LDSRGHGWRVQLHSAVLSRNNCDLTRRFPSVRDSLLTLPARSTIIDGELVACDFDDKPDFKALMVRRVFCRGLQPATLD